MGDTLIRYWSSGVDVSGFSSTQRSNAMRKRLTYGAADDVPLIIHAGRLTVDKGSHKLPTIFEAIARRLHGHVRFAIFGDGERRLQIEADCREKNLTLFCEGALQGSELHTAMASGDVFVSPCCTEAIGLCLMEAMASGVPAVAPNVGGTSEIIVHSQNGFLFEGVPTFDYDACADMVVTALEQRRHGLSERAAQSMRSNTWQQSMAELDAALYASLSP